MLPSEYYIESCTLFDDQYLSYHDLIENKSDVSSGGDSMESRPHLSAGGFSYVLKNDYRFIIWRVNGNQLELIEQSLVHKLADNCKRIHFKNGMIIPRVLVHSEFKEAGNTSPNIQILVSTTSKLYRLIFQINLNECTTKSVFYGFSASNLTNIEPFNSYAINLNQVDTNDLTVSPSGEALFAFVMPNHSIACVQMPALNKINYSTNQQQQQNLPTRFELNQPNIVKRLWSGITRTAAQDTHSQIISFKFFSHHNTTYLISLCRDLRLKVWCLKSAQCILADEIAKYVQIDSAVEWDEAKIEMSSNNPQLVILTIVLKSHDEFKICNLKLDIHDSANVRISQYSQKSVCKKGKLISVESSGSKIWLMYKNENESIEIVGLYTEAKNSNLIFLEENSLKSDKFRNNDLNEDEEDENDLDDDLLTVDTSKGDIKEAFLKLVFEPYRFSKSNIFKALGILRSSGLNDLKQMPKSNEELKELLIDSIEKEVQSHPNIQSCSEEEFLYLNSKCWSKFYTMLKQYDYDSRLPVSLFIDRQNESMVVLIRKNSMSVFNFADLSQMNKPVQIESVKFYLKENDIGVATNFIEQQANDLLALCMCLNRISANLHLNDSAQSNTLEQFDTLVESLEFHDLNVLLDVNSLNQVIKSNGLLPTIQLIIDIIEHELLTSSSLNDSDQMEDDYLAPGSTYLKSDFTFNSFMANFFHLIKKRYTFLKSLLVLIIVLRRFYESLSVPKEAMLEMSRRFVEPCLSLLNGYEYLKWLAHISPVHVSKQDLERNKMRVYDLVDNFTENASLFDPITSTTSTQILLKTFLSDPQNKPIFELNSLLKASINLLKFDQINSYFMRKIIKLVWPSNYDESLQVVKYLLINAQYMHLENLCQITKSSPKGRNLRFFLMANCCLFFNTVPQSIDLFLKASYHLSDDKILRDFMKIGVSSNCPPGDAKRKKLGPKFNQSLNLNNSTYLENMSILLNEEVDSYDLEIDDKILLNYYVKVIHYYELNGNFEAEIELVQNALVKSRFDVNSRSKLYCILFKSYMSLEYYEKAQSTIIQLDDEWKGTCLKHFISELCNMNKTAKLIGFEYGDLLHDVLRILYERASKSDLRTHDYYSIIYALHVKHKDYLKAASCMYECAVRLKREVNGINSLKRQEKCYLACLNVLKLMDKKFAWIIKYNEKSACNEVTFDTTTTSTRSNLIQLDNKKPKNPNELIDENLDVKIVDLNEINRNYQITSHIIKLSTILQNQSNVNNHFLPEEVIGMLVKYGYFDDAFVMSKLFKLPPNNVLLGLVDRCCMEEGKDVDTGKFISDMQSEYDFLKNNDSLSISQLAYEHPSTFKWKLLDIYLTKLNNPVYYKLVCERLLKHCYELPEFVSHAFKRLDPNALLQVLIEFNCWEEAIKLVNEQMNSVLSDSRMNDWIQTNRVNCVHLPYTSIDRILYALTKSSDKEMLQKGNELKKKVNDCVARLKSVSDSIKLMKKNRI